jgi:hypothetical protein
MSRLCRGAHPILLIREFNSAGAVVDCTVCGDTFQVREATLANRYIHFHHTSGEGERGDMDLFVSPSLVEDPAKFAL